MAIGRSSERALQADLAALVSRRDEVEVERRSAIMRQQTVRARALGDELTRIARRHGELLRELPRYATSEVSGRLPVPDAAGPSSG